MIGNGIRMGTLGRCLLFVCVFVVPVLLGRPYLHARVNDSVQEYADKGNQLYGEGKYDEALEAYQAAIELAPDVAELRYNQGNAYVKLKKRGYALAAYLRARIRDPRNQDIQKNIDFLNSQIEYRVEDRTNWYVMQWRVFLGFLSAVETAALWWGGLALFLGLIIVRIWVGRRLLIRLLLWLVVPIVLCSGLMHLSRLTIYTPGSPAVTIRQAEVRYGPSEQDKVLFKLVEGMEVYVIDRRGQWSRIVLLNKESGWVSNNELILV